MNSLKTEVDTLISDYAQSLESLLGKHELVRVHGDSEERKIFANILTLCDRTLEELTLISVCDDRTIAELNFGDLHNDQITMAKDHLKRVQLVVGTMKVEG